MSPRDLPPPLPPEERTVGQLVAETIRLYGRKFWPSLALGLVPALLAAASAELTGLPRWVLVLGAGAPLLAATLVGAVAVAHPVARRRLATAFTLGILAFTPLVVSRLVVFPGIYLLALAWFSLLALGVPAALVEDVGLRRAAGRGIRLARADFVHALGSLATLVIVIVLTMFVLFSTLRTFGEQGSLAATMLVFLLLAPLFFLGTALLYGDQAARQRLKEESRRGGRK